MRVGVVLPQYSVDREPDAGPVLDGLLDASGVAERLGLDAVWLSDHAFAVGPDGQVSGALEPLVLVAALARTTSRIRLGTLVLAATMRSPSAAAHAASTLARCAPGRVVIGLGAGWYEPEHRAFGVPLPTYRERVASLGAAVSAVRALGAARPEILVGGAGQPILAVAARGADRWNLAWDPPPDGFARLSRRLDAACERLGRDPSSLTRSVGVTVLVGAGERDLDHAVERLRRRARFLSQLDRAVLEGRIVVGSPERCAERIASYGADEVVIAPLLRDDHEMLALVASELAPRLRAI